VCTLIVASWLFGGRIAPGRDGPRHAAHTTTVQPPPELPPLPADVLAEFDAEEQVNIRVYSSCNRGVVNITVASIRQGLFDDVVSSGSGSGFVIDRKGHVLTNFHVVENAREVRVTLYDGSTHEAEVIGTDPTTDLAVVRLDVSPETLFPLELGDSSRLLVGQKVLALGNPFGLERTLTTGIISALDRSIKARNRRVIKGIIQTDAAINPGNSGGPLLNSRGQVIGMNTAILSQVGQSAGISFTVPISSIERILPQLLERGFVVRADLGVSRVLTTDEGLLVVRLTEDGAARRAGLREPQLVLERVNRFTTRRRIDADIVAAIDGKPVRNVEELLTEVESRAPGEAVTLDVIRDGKHQQIKVTLGAGTE
jgi:S1-C subfamily serine protease